MPDAVPDPARNRPAAARLEPGRPFPAYRSLESHQPHPRRDPRGHSHGAPDPAPGQSADRWRDDATWRFGIDLWHAGYAWEAHEQWEAGYFADRDPVHRALLQGLIQMAAASIQAHRGRGAGVRLLARAAERRIASVAATLPPGGRFAGLDVHAVLADVRRHFGPALADAAPEADAARVVGPPPCLDVGP